MGERSAVVEVDAMGLVGRFLVIVLIAGFLLDVGDVLEVSSHLSTDRLIALSFVGGALAVTWLYGDRFPYSNRLSQPFDRIDPSDIEMIVRLTTRNLIVLYVLLVGLAYSRLEIHHHVNLTALFSLTVFLLTLSLALDDSERAILATKIGAVLVTVVALSSVFSDSIDEYVTSGTYLLALVLVGLVLWKEDIRNRPDTHQEPLTVAGVSVFVLGIGAATVLAAILYIYRLGAFHLQGDEYLVADAAASYYYTGELYLWDWIRDGHADRYYDRAWPHTLLVAASYAIFGVSEWSARLISALFGVAFIPICYLVVWHFTEHRTVALATSAGAAVYPRLLFYFRWARMYALLLPLFLVLTYLVFRATTEGNSLDLRNDRLNAAVEQYFDFNLTLGFVTVPVLYVAYQIHYNALIVLAATYVYVVYRAMTTGERKYWTAWGLGLVGIIALALLAQWTPYAQFLEQFLSFFERNNTVYVEYLLQFPFESALGIVFFVAGLVTLQRIENGPRRQKLIFLYVLCLFSLVFYLYVGDRYASFAYIVHVVPFGLALVLFAYAEFVRAIDVPILQVMLVLLLVTSIVYPIATDYEDYYYEDSEDFTTAYGTIVEEFNSDGEVLFAQYPRDYYLRELPSDTTVIDMENNQEYKPDEFYDDLERHGSGWITWETDKSYHVHPEIREYADEHFEKRHGSGVDNTNVEVYYFNESMIE
ncbi:glycosyltransferase family 39 protein [Halosolutus halophilus]|uniref:glycosyltransferase family 39 protein n=1 Tax=Halosolutus halophilus TaxID=1552990 RepID=UPI0022352F12|nr:glycosyltransferase family 39 protein [Halosolutus halophilus]